jgi:hypothetical protein
MPSIRQRRQRRSRQIRRLMGGRRSRRGDQSMVMVPQEEVAVLATGEVLPVEEVVASDQVVDVLPANGGRSRKLRRGRRASRAAQRGGRAVSLKTAVRLLRNYYAKRYA